MYQSVINLWYQLLKVACGPSHRCDMRMPLPATKRPQHAFIVSYDKIICAISVYDGAKAEVERPAIRYCKEVQPLLTNNLAVITLYT